MNIRNLGILVFTILIGTAISVTAQVNPQMQQQQTPDFSEETLEAFVEVNMKIEKVQMEGQEKMRTAIKEEGLDVATYSNIARAEQSMQQQEIDANEEDMEAYNNAQKKVESLQAELKEQMVEIVGNHNISVQEFQKIAQAYQTNPELKQEISKIQQEKMKESATPEKQMN